MIIMMEGPDNVGKSTQIKMLLKYLIDKPTYVIHFSGISGITSNESRKYSELMYDDMFNIIKEANNNDRNLIFDRSHIGEFVYSPLYRNYSGEYIFDIEKKYLDIIKNVYLFTFIDNPVNLLKREDGNSFTIDVHKKEQEIDLFKEAYRKTNIKHKYIVDVSEQSIDSVHMFVRGIICGY